MRPDEAPERPESSTRRPRITGSSGTPSDDLSLQSPSSVSFAHPVLFTDDDGDVSVTSADEEDHGGAHLDPDSGASHCSHLAAFSCWPAQLDLDPADDAEDREPPSAGATPLFDHQSTGAWILSPGLDDSFGPQIDGAASGLDELDEDTMPNPSLPLYLVPQGAEMLGIPAASPAPPSGAAIIPPVLYQPPPSLTPTDIAEHLQALAGTGSDDGDGSVAPFQHQVPFVHPDSTIIGGTNQNLPDFLYTWYRQRRPPGGRPAYRVPWPSKANEQISSHISHVQYADLEGDCCDFQGLNWEHMGVSRRDARERRSATYHNYINKENSDQFTPSDASLPNTGTFFRFRRMDIKRNVLIMHFQLRNIFAATSRAETFYTADHAVLRFDPVSGFSKTVMTVPYTQVSTIAARHGVLMAGCFNGEYVLRHTDSRGDSTGCEVGTITKDSSGITNHIQIYQSRTGSSPIAVIASNDKGVRTLDLNTRTWLSTVRFSTPINCTAVSPDRRLRVVVGDDTSVYVVPAESTLAGETPEIFYKLDAHRDSVFACDWADDGWTVATGCQDRTVKIWDARKWTDSSGAAKPVTSIRSEMACVRSLHFSPIGSGKRVLVAVEEADFVSVIDAHTFRSKQRFDVLGEIGGAAFTGDGQDLHVLCADFARGGIMQLERCALGSEASWGVSPREDSTSFDWPPSVFTEKKYIQQSPTRRRRRAAALDALEPF